MHFAIWFLFYPRLCCRSKDDDRKYDGHGLVTIQASLLEINKTLQCLCDHQPSLWLVEWLWHSSWEPKKGWPGTIADVLEFGVQKRPKNIYTVGMLQWTAPMMCLLLQDVSNISVVRKNMIVGALFAVGETPCKFCATLQLKDVSSASSRDSLYTLKSLGKRECNLQISHAWFISEDALIPMDKQRGTQQHAAILDNCIKGIPWRFPKRN